MKWSMFFRRLLGVVAVLLLCYCFVVFLGTWLLLPKWPGESDMHSLAFRVEMSLGCVAVGIGCLGLVQWCFFGSNSKE